MIVIIFIEKKKEKNQNVLTSRCSISLASQTLSSPTDIWVDGERGSGTTSTLDLFKVSTWAVTCT